MSLLGTRLQYFVAMNPDLQALAIALQLGIPEEITAQLRDKRGPEGPEGPPGRPGTPGAQATRTGSAVLADAGSCVLTFDPALPSAEYTVAPTFLPSDGVVPSGFGVDPATATAAGCTLRWAGSFTGTLRWRAEEML